MIYRIILISKPTFGNHEFKTWGCFGENVLDVTPFHVSLRHCWSSVGKGKRHIQAIG
jgi:hypothetical protein